MADFQWRCPTHGVIDTVLDIINPDHPTCPVLLRRRPCRNWDGG
jgi:hypothetical protein